MAGTVVEAQSNIFEELGRSGSASVGPGGSGAVSLVVDWVACHCMRAKWGLVCTRRGLLSVSESCTDFIGSQGPTCLS